MEETKICKACTIDKPVADFYFRKETNKYKNVCKSCCISGKKIEKSTTHKVCKHCNEEKPVSEYQKAGGGKWLQPYCKPCDAERKRKHFKDNEDRMKEGRRKYYLETRTLVDPEQRKVSQQEVVKKMREGLAKYNEMNPPMAPGEKKSRKSEIVKRYRENNADRIKFNKLKYKESGRANDMAKEWQKKKRSDIAYVTKKRLRGRIYVALKRGVKSQSTMDLLGCSIDFFKNHFESLFTEGMSWDKYMAGEIVIDHIKPCKRFDLTDPEQQKECFFYKNLQPLWELDNLIKGSKYGDD